MLLKRFQASDKRVRQIKRRIRSYSVISFDIFDTLILRRVLKPSDVFRLMSAEVLKILSKSKNKSIDFPFERVKAERDARRDLIIRDGVGKVFEINFAQIYAQLQKNLKLTDKQTQQIQKLELETELKCCVAHPKIKQVYDYCIQQKKQVWFVSDMYLAKSDIIKILKNAGYKHKDMSKNVIVSSEYNATKHNGNLFEVLLEKTKAHPRYILHIGDSLKADVLGARKNKIRSSYLRKLFKPHHKKHHKYSLSKSVQIALQDINKLEDKDYFSNLGYSLIGPLMLQFCHWIYKDVKKRGIKKIYFLSRDGYLPYEAFKILFGHDKEVEPVYLMFSSRATGYNIKINTGQKHFTDQQMVDLYRHNWFPSCNLKDLFDRMLFDISKYENILVTFDLSLEKRIITDGDSKKFKKLVKFLEPQIISNIRTVQKNYIAYLKEQGVLAGGQNNIAIVDSGWSGKIQNNLYYLLKKSSSIKYLVGYYLGLNQRAEGFQSGKNIYNAFLWQFENPRISNAGFIENFLSSDSPSLSHMGIVKNKIKLFYLNILQDSSTQERFACSRNEALKFVRDYISICAERKQVDLEPGVLSRQLNRLMARPSRKDVINLGSCDISHKLKKEIAPGKRISFVQLPKRGSGVFSKYSLFIESYWKAGYYKLLPINDKILLFPLYIAWVLKKYWKKVRNFLLFWLKSI